MHRMNQTVLLGLLVARVAAAQAFNPQMPANVPEVTGAVVQNLNMHYIDVAIGSSALAAPGKQHTVHYTAWLRNGTKFDSFADRNDPFKVVQAHRQVISGCGVAFEVITIGRKRP